MSMAMNWSTMLYFGLDGYIDATRRIVEVSHYIALIHYFISKATIGRFK
jgi:hypothetical protein